MGTLFGDGAVFEYLEYIVRICPHELSEEQSDGYQNRS